MFGSVPNNTRTHGTIWLHSWHHRKPSVAENGYYISSAIQIKRLVLTFLLGTSKTADFLTSSLRRMRNRSIATIHSGWIPMNSQKQRQNATYMEKRLCFVFGGTVKVWCILRCWIMVKCLRQTSTIEPCRITLRRQGWIQRWQNFCKKTPSRTSQRSRNRKSRN